MDMNGLRNQAVSFATVESRNLLMDLNAGGETKEIKNFKAIYNAKRDKVVACMGNDYNIVQHKEWVSAFADAVGRLNMPCSVDYCKEFGNKIVIDIDFSGFNISLKEKGEEFTAGIRLINSYDGTTGLMMLPRMKRLVCSNGMIATFVTKGLHIRHNSKLVEVFEAKISEQLNHIINSSQKLQAWVLNAFEDSKEWEIAEAVLNKLFKEKKHREAIYELLLKEKKTIDQKTFTRWDLYNALTSYATHNQALSGYVEMAISRKAVKVLTGNLTELAKTEQEITISRD